jgi:predicted RNA binding protein YcfA (HicA-like mRNA interferase family)
MVDMKAREVLQKIKQGGCAVVRQKGSHAFIRCPNGCTTVLPMHAGEDLKIGLLKAIEKDLEACLGKGWLTN